MAEAEQYRRSSSSSPSEFPSDQTRPFRHAAPAPGTNGTVADVFSSGDLHVDIDSLGSAARRSGAHSDHTDANARSGTADGVATPVKRARHAAVAGDESPTIPIPPVAADAAQRAPARAQAEPSVPSPANGEAIVDRDDAATSADVVGATAPADPLVAAASGPDGIPALTDSEVIPPPAATTPITDTTEGAPSENGHTEIAIEVVDLQKRFGDNVAVESVSFSVVKGSILALLGPNGAGKTTTVNMLCTLLKPDGGTATVAGHDVVSDAAGVRRSIMLTGQFAALDEALSGRDNLILFGRLMGLTKSAARARADELLTSFDLTAAAKRRVGEYSGGMRRRIDIACGLVTQPEVVFLDEPTTGLDPRSRQEVWKLVESLRDQGVTTLLTTQYLEEADTLSDHIVVIDRGRVIASGTADELKTATGASHYEVTPTNPDDIRDLVECLRDLMPAGTPAPERSVDDSDIRSVAIPAPDGADTLVEIVQRTTRADIRLSDVALRRPSLDEVFLALTDPARAPAAAGSAPSTDVGRDTSA